MERVRSRVNVLLLTFADRYRHLLCYSDDPACKCTSTPILHTCLYDDLIPHARSNDTRSKVQIASSLQIHEALEHGSTE
jgi:hypothetical protein